MGIKTKRIPWSNMIICFLIIIFLILSAQVISPSFNGEKVISLGSGFTYTTKPSQPPMEVTLPTNRLDNPINNEVTLNRSLPSDFKMGASILLKTSHQIAKVFVNDEMIFSFGYNTPHPVGKSFGNAWHIIRLPNDYMGKELEITLKSPYASYGTVANDVAFGTKSSLVFSVIKNNIANTAVGALMLVIGVTLILFYYAIFRLSGKAKSIVNLSAFSIVSGIWLLAESQLIGFMLNAPLLYYNISSIALLILPLPLLYLFSTNSILGKTKLIKNLILIHRIFVIAALITTLIRVTEFINIITVYYLFLAAEIVVIMILCVKNRRKKSVKLVLLANIAIVLCLVIDAVFNYFSPLDTSIHAIPFGLLAFLLIVGIDAGKHVMSSSRDSVYNSALTQLAYTDTMTGLKNRTSFQENFDSFDKDPSKLENAAIAVADLNFLKQINDNLGHKKGDDMIILSADALAQSFGRYGSVYRIGGDEFAVIMPNVSAAQCNEAVNSFKRAVKQYNKFNGRCVFSVAIGVERFNRAYDNNINDLFSRADAAMYNNKSAIKSNFKFPTFIQTNTGDNAEEKPLTTAKDEI